MSRRVVRAWCMLDEAIGFSVVGIEIFVVVEEAEKGEGGAGEEADFEAHSFAKRLREASSMGWKSMRATRPP